MTYYAWKNNDLYLKVYVQPRAKKNAIVGLHDGHLKIQIKAVPDDGKANAELLSFLAERLHIATSKIHIESGHHGRNKLIRVISVSLKNPDATFGVCQP